jgi:hypothetical protein
MIGILKIPPVFVVTQNRKRREDFHLLGANPSLNRLGETTQLGFSNSLVC